MKIEEIKHPFFKSNYHFPIYSLQLSNPGSTYLIASKTYCYGHDASNDRVHESKRSLCS